MDGFQTVIYEKKDHIGYVTLNRPQALNAYSVQMRDDLYEVLSAIKDDDEVRVAIVKGAGDKAFCAGADLTGDEALSIGLVNRVVPQAELLPAVEGIARTIASFEPMAVRKAKEAVLRGADLPLSDGLNLERRLASGLTAATIQKAKTAVEER